MTRPWLGAVFAGALAVGGVGVAQAYDVGSPAPAQRDSIEKKVATPTTDFRQKCRGEQDAVMRINCECVVVTGG